MQAIQDPKSDKSLSFMRCSQCKMCLNVVRDAIYRTTGYGQTNHGLTLATAQIPCDTRQVQYQGMTQIFEIMIIE